MNEVGAGWGWDDAVGVVLAGTTGGAGELDSSSFFIFGSGVRGHSWWGWVGI